MKLRIEQDNHYESPRDWDNQGTMVCFHKRYDLGDKHEYKGRDHTGWEDMEALIVEVADPAVILSLYLYDHSGITMSTGPFACGWDSGQVGFIFVSKEKVRKEWGWKRITNNRIKKITKQLEDEVKIYDQYLTGDVWGYVLEDDNGNHLDSCWGFYGREYCEQVAEDMKKQHEEDARRTARLTVPCGCTA